MFQSLGVNNPKYNHFGNGLATALAGIILVGNLSFPIFTQTGLINEDNRKCPASDVNVLECLAEQAEGATNKIAKSLLTQKCQKAQFQISGKTTSSQ